MSASWTPNNVAAGNSSGYNYASGRLDHQTYFKAIRVEQSQFELVILDRILAVWLDEAALIGGLLPRSAGPVLSHQWFWNGNEHVDPAKEAGAQDVHLGNHTSTLAIEYARQGLDWEEALRQRAKEVALMKELGLTMASTAAQQSPTKDESKPDDEEADDRAA